MSLLLSEACIHAYYLHNEFQNLKYWTFSKVWKSKILSFLKKKSLKFSCWRACTEYKGRQFGQKKRTNKKFWHSCKGFRVSPLRVLQHDGVSWSTADRKLDSQTFFSLLFPSQQRLLRLVLCFVSGRKRGWRAVPPSQQKKKTPWLGEKEQTSPYWPLEKSGPRGSLFSVWKSSVHNLFLLALGLNL